MRKVMTLVGTRPELIKMSRVMAEMDRQVTHVLVHSGKNYDFELHQVFLMTWESASQTIFSVLRVIAWRKPSPK